MASLECPAFQVLPNPILSRFYFGGGGFRSSATTRTDLANQRELPFTQSNIITRMERLCEQSWSLLRDNRELGRSLFDGRPPLYCDLNILDGLKNEELIRQIQSIVRCFAEEKKKLIGGLGQEKANENQQKFIDDFYFKSIPVLQEESLFKDFRSITLLQNQVRDLADPIMDLKRKIQIVKEIPELEECKQELFKRLDEMQRAKKTLQLQLSREGEEYSRHFAIYENNVSSDRLLSFRRRIDNVSVQLLKEDSCTLT